LPADFDPAALLEVLEAHAVEYVVIGAQAAMAHGSPIVTRDLDITPSTGRENVERLAAALGALGARLRSAAEPQGVVFPIEADMLRSADVWTLTTRAGDLDVVFTPAGTRGYEDLRRDATRFELGAGLTVLVASLLDVIRSKEAAGRAKDVAQLPLLRRTLDEIGRRESGA